MVLFVLFVLLVSSLSLCRWRETRANGLKSGLGDRLRARSALRALLADVGRQRLLLPLPLLLLWLLLVRAVAARPAAVPSSKLARRKLSLAPPFRVAVAAVMLVML